jgi:uncharacterized DUF497 family protein
MQMYIQNIRVDGFEWDKGNIEKCQTHGMTPAEIEQVFDNVVQIAGDAAHSQDEARQLLIGRTLANRPAFVVFTLRRHDERLLIRPLSARYMHARELKRYEP